MSSSSSPYRLAAERNIDLFETVLEKEREALDEAQFAADIGSKMRVPKRITVTGSEDDVFSIAPVSFNRASSYTSAEDPVMRNMMMVPDRILVAGQDRHIGAKGPPRELQLEQAIMPHEPDTVRVQVGMTPPRVLTLDEFKFPAADDPPANTSDVSEKYSSSVSTRESSLTVNGNISLVSKFELETSFLPNTTADSSGVNRAALEEYQMLRQQLLRLNRRVMTLEAENLQKQQRDVFLGILAVAYAVIKCINWLRN